jgi:hypothetical protein
MSAVLMAILMLGLAPQPVKAHVELIQARYELRDNGLLEESIPCNPPLPDSSYLSCFKIAQSWYIACDDPRTIDILPQKAYSAYYDFGKARERGEKFWCVLAVTLEKPER